MTVQVLVVEDDPILAHELGFLLQSMAYEVIGLAANCREAIALSEKAKPHIALVDLKLSDGMTGLGLADQLERRWGTTVALVTGCAKTLDAFEQSGRLLLAKPLDDIALGALMREAQRLCEAR